MKAYLEATRSPWYSLIFVVPLWLLYEILATVLNFGHREMILNGADAMVSQAFAFLGVHGWLATELCIAAVATVWVCRVDSVHRKQPLRPQYLLGMGIESVIYALLLGGLVVRLMRLLIPHFLLSLDAGAAALTLGQQFMTSLGAGIFEELVFRVILMGGLAWAGVRFLRMKPAVSLVVAIVLSSLVFSAFHYIGPMAYHLTVASFMFRFLAGVVLAVIYKTRGFGIAACTHAFYDVMLVVQKLHGH